MSKPKSLFAVGQIVRLKRNVSEDYGQPDKWAGARVEVVALVLNKDEYLYQLKHNDGSEHLFEEIEIDQRYRKPRH